GGKGGGGGEGKSGGPIDGGRAKKSFGRNADEEELAAVYEYPTPLPGSRSAPPGGWETGRPGPVERASGARDNQPPPIYLIRNAISRSRERSHDMRHRRLGEL